MLYAAVYTQSHTWLCMWITYVLMCFCLVGKVLHAFSHILWTAFLLCKCITTADKFLISITLKSTLFFFSIFKFCSYLMKSLESTVSKFPGQNLWGKKIWLYCQNAFLKYEMNLHSSEQCDKTGFVIPNFHSSFPGQYLDKTLFHVLHRIECVSEAVVDKHNAQCWHIFGLAAMWTESQPRLASGQNKIHNTTY